MNLDLSPESLQRAANRAAELYTEIYTQLEQRRVDPVALREPLRDLLANRLGDGRDRPATNSTPFEGSFTRFPVLSEIAVTYRCNLACTFCYAGCGTPDASPGNMALEKHRNWWKFWRKTRWWHF